MGCTSWLLIHRLLMNQGFTLRSRGLSTDTKAALLLGVTASLWTATFLAPEVHAMFGSDAAWEAALLRLIEAPLIVDILFLF
jgi:hypothetical protein